MSSTVFPESGLVKDEEGLDLEDLDDLVDLSPESGAYNSNSSPKKDDLAPSSSLSSSALLSTELTALDSRGNASSAGSDSKADDDDDFGLSSAKSLSNFSHRSETSRKSNSDNNHLAGVSIVRIDDFISGGNCHSRDDDDELDDDANDDNDNNSSNNSSSGQSGNYYFKYNPNAIALKSYYKDDDIDPDPLEATSPSHGHSSDSSSTSDSISDTIGRRFEEDYVFEDNHHQQDHQQQQQQSLGSPTAGSGPAATNIAVGGGGRGDSSPSLQASSRMLGKESVVVGGGGYDSDSSFDLIEEADLTGGERSPKGKAGSSKNSSSNNVSSNGGNNSSNISKGSTNNSNSNSEVMEGRGKDSPKSPVIAPSLGHENGSEEEELVYRSQIVYSSKGQEVSLRTRLGELHYSAGEFEFYQCMFKISDLKNSGRLNNNNSHLPILLLRTGIESTRMEKILNLVNLKKPESSGNEPLGLSFNQWLVLCKLIVYAQDVKNSGSDINEGTVSEISEQSKSNIAKYTTVSHPVSATGSTSSTATVDSVDSRPVVMCNFSLGKPMRLPQAQDHHYKVVVKGFRSYGNGYEQHIKFILLSKVFTVAKGNREVIGSGKGNVIESTRMHNPTEIEVVRRYSDFELLVDILQKCNPGIILPALPPKAWWSDNVESTAQKRCHLLQLFLSDITHHPLLRLSYELKAFLEASSTGFKSFREMYPKFVGPVGSLSATNQSYVGYVGENIAYGVTKAYSMIYGLISKVAKTITFENSSLETVPCLCSTPELEKRITKSLKEYKLAETLGASLEKFHGLEQDITTEICAIAFDLKQTSDLMNDTLLDPIVAIFNKFAEKYGLVQTSYLEDQSKTVNTNIQYLGTYHASLVTKTSEIDTLKELLNGAKKQQQYTRSQLALAGTTVNTTPSMRAALERDVATADKDFEAVKNQDKLMYDNVSLEVRHLEGVKSKKLQDNSEEFVKGRIQNCQDNIKLWSDLLAVLKDSKTWRADMSGVLDEKNDA